ncbi:MAG: hypothetical protein IPO36_04725 [Anaerolineales bacterium]|nr:hypothetical protein [Anaerolineales bacterium]
MVHALDEIRRTLKSDGILIDLRPVEDRWAVEVASQQEIQTAGQLTDMPIGRADDEAAFPRHARGGITRLVHTGTRRGIFLFLLLGHSF